MNSVITSHQSAVGSLIEMLAGLMPKRPAREVLPHHRTRRIFAPGGMVAAAFYPPSRVQATYYHNPHTTVGYTPDFRSFEERILTGRIDRTRGCSASYASAVLPRGMSDAKLRSLIPRYHLSSIRHVAEMLVAQSGGCGGILPTEEHSGAICYVRGAKCKTYALLITYEAGWRVRAYERVPNLEWCEGYHVIYPL